MKNSGKSLRAVLWGAAILVAVLVAAAPVAAATFASGDVLVSVGNGKWNWYSSSGAVKGTLDDASGSAQTTGGAFNDAGQFYGTDFAAKNVHNFDTSGVLIGAVGSGYTFSPESILFGCVNDVNSILVGTSDNTGATGNILQFDSSGNLVTTFVVGTENKGADWIELLSDHCTVYYTSEGTGILAYNLCTNSQSGDFVTPGNGLLNHNLPKLDAAYTLRQIQGGTFDGQWLLADNSTILRINAAGNAVLDTYDDAADPGSGAPFNVKTWYGLSVDPDGLGFWASDFQSGYLDHFVISTGAVNHTVVVPGIHSPGAGGVIVVGTVLPGGPICPPPGAVKVTGGGQIDVAGPESHAHNAKPTKGVASYGFNAKPGENGGPATGHFNYVNHATRLHVWGPVDDIEVIAFNPDGSPKTVQFSGTCQSPKTSCTFVVTVEDHGEPGTSDEFGVTISGDVSETESQRVISRGNIQFHKP